MNTESVIYNNTDYSLFRANLFVDPYIRFLDDNCDPNFQSTNSNILILFICKIFGSLKSIYMNCFLVSKFYKLNLKMKQIKRV